MMISVSFHKLVSSKPFLQRSMVIPIDTGREWQQRWCWAGNMYLLWENCVGITWLCSREPWRKRGPKKIRKERTRKTEREQKEATESPSIDNLYIHTEDHVMQPLQRKRSRILGAQLLKIVHPLCTWGCVLRPEHQVSGRSTSVVKPDQRHKTLWKDVSWIWKESKRFPKQCRWERIELGHWSTFWRFPRSLISLQYQYFDTISTIVPYLRNKSAVSGIFKYSCFFG